MRGEGADAVIGEIEPLQRRFRELTADTAHLDAVLREGLERAAVTADKTLADVAERVGLA